ncbi:hypothetical protein PBY51_001742 [Eleginops maclovinus]|uniref:DBF4-type domain-containing protein n=1 Tax=Eleginops maclovinus TaxID=56733 RepID=A0AAN7WYK4_ELEMC|nr:hypothetical protein PBY51_001742 [Eleginops maclovinus]
MQQQQGAEEGGLLGSLCPGQKKLHGKTFYLDSLKKRSTALLLEAVSLLGGKVESFLHKDISFLVTGSQDGLKEQKSTDIKIEANGKNDEAQHPIMQRESILSREKRRPGTPRPTACGSRGKALLEKAIRNNERLHTSSVLMNARSWGVKVVYVDDVLLYLKHLTRESFDAPNKRPEQKTHTKQQGAQVVKAVALRASFVKIEDSSRKYKPILLQNMTLPTLRFSGRFSPFEIPPPPRLEKRPEKGEDKTREKKTVESSIKSQTPLSCNPMQPPKKNVSYCECCNQPFHNLEEHIQYEQHRAFALDASNYRVMDQLVAEMLPGFNTNPDPQSEEALDRPLTPLPFCELEPLTDAETEHAVQSLQRGSPSNIHISSPTRGPLSSGAASPSPGVQLTIPDPPASPPADIQPFTTNTDCQLPVSLPRASSPAMPVLDIEPQDHNSANQHLDIQDLSPCPSPDPYSLPPVLSPQMLYTSYVMEPHFLYSEPPVLSPQTYPAEEAGEGHTCEMDTEDSVSHSVPDLTRLFPFVSLTDAEGVEESNQETFLAQITCSTNGFKLVTHLSHRSRSLPRHQSATEPNPKKRCRSASPEHSRSKRRRITADFGYSGSWTTQGHTAAKPERDTMADPQHSSFFDKIFCRAIQRCPAPDVSSTCNVESLGSKQTLTTFCVPTVLNFLQTPQRLETLGYGGTSAAVQISQPLSSTSKTCDPPLQSPNDQSPSELSSLDSKRLLSHSTSVCIESSLIPDLARHSSSSSDSDWDCGLLSRLGPTSAAPLSPVEQSCELDPKLLHMPCTWMHDTSYESRLHDVLQPPNPAGSLCGEEMDPSAFSRTLVQIVEVQY